MVGAATGVPMADETNEFKGPFVEAGWNPDEIFYFGESALLPEYRGQGEPPSGQDRRLPVCNRAVRGLGRLRAPPVRPGQGVSFGRAAACYDDS